MTNKDNLRRRGAAVDDDQLAVIAENIAQLSRHVHPPVPNPSPLGLLAFGLTTCLLQVKITGIAGLAANDLAGVDTAVMGFAMFFGGLVQLIAGISEIRRNNIFGYTAFCLYGGFWMSVSLVLLVSLLAPHGPPPLNPIAWQAMLFMIGVISFIFWVLTFKMNFTICLLFGLLVATVFLLSFGVRNPNVDKLGGYFGIATSAVAFWLAFAELVNDVLGEGKHIIPLGQWHHNKFKDSGALHVPGRIHGHRVSQITQESAPNSRETTDVEEGIDEGEAAMRRAES